MKNKKLFLLLSLITILGSCSKGDQKTSAKLSLRLSGIVNLNSGVGSGGAILFGKSSSGEQFGKIITGTEANLDLLNGEWSFYTVMWDKNSNNNLSDVVYCGKSTNKLSGQAVSINLDLSNAICAESVFSGGKHYSKYATGAGLKNTFAKMFVEDCDDLSQAGIATCNLDNQGNALSYRLNFKSYNKSASGALVFSDEVIKSQCVTYSDVNASGMNVNFPTSNSAMPFVVSMEMYLGSSDCGTSIPETKGMYTHIFDQGLEIQSPNTKMVFRENSTCSPKNSNTPNVCAEFLGTMSASVCNVPETISKFTALEDCINSPAPTTNTTSKNIKHIFSIPKNIFCFADISKYGASDTNLFPAGNGSMIRPFKICNEWQINQIGEMGSSPLMSNYHYKLLNDLDMNKTDFGPFPKPLCTREIGSKVGEHHNFNPLDKLFASSCSDINSTPSFKGGFNGNNKTISHARIQAEGVAGLGFVRKLQSGSIKNLKFINLEIYGGSKVGGIAGSIDAISDVGISNITIDGLDLEGKNRGLDQNSNGSNVGSVAGLILKNNSTVTINRFLVTDAEIYGSLMIGGLVGENSSASISESKYSGMVRQEGGPGIVGSSVGGLVGQNNGGIISTSVSEGMIRSYSTYSGGIIGYNTQNGKVYDSYSTMYMNASGQYVAGIIGKNLNGDFNNVFFNGIIETYIYPDRVFEAISSNASTVTPTNCKFTNYDYNYNTNTNNNAGCSQIAIGSLMSGVGLPSNGLWQTNLGQSIPRLKWEGDINSRLCLKSDNNKSVIDQKNLLSKGSSANNPIVVCNKNQFSQLSSLGVNDFAVLGDNLNLSEFTFSQVIPNFLGKLNGRNHTIYGLKISSPVSNSNQVALFKKNSGTISHLNIIGNRLESDALTNYTGILTAKNSGTIKNIKFISNTLSGISDVGMVAGENSGLIEMIEIRESTINGFSNVGGIAGTNALNANNVPGVIRRVSFNGSISNISDDNHHLGGIAGSNLGVIDQAKFDGTLSCSFPLYPFTEAFIGGIAGLNQGLVSNTLTTNYSQISSNSPNHIGGLVGKNEGVLNTSIALGSVLYNNLSVSTMTTFSATVGESTGEEHNLYFLEKKLGTSLSVQTIATCSGLATFQNNIFQTFTPDLYIPNFYGSNSNELTTFKSFVINSNNSIIFSGDCYQGQTFNFLKTHGPQGLPPGYFSNPANFTALNMAYPGHLDENVLEYHKALMYKREPAMALPIWVMEEEDSHPKLLQIDH